MGAVGVAGLLLAAGAGSRMGRPKALVHDEAGSWLVRGVETLVVGGCAGVTVVLGARADDARALLDGLAGHEVRVVVADDWARGMSASLRTGLESLGADGPGSAEAALVHLVDLPDVGPEVVARLVAASVGAGDPNAALARATYDGRPGHPVLIGRDHWDGVLGSLAGDEGARGYLGAHAPAYVECGDLATGRDVDSRPSEGR